MTIEDESERVRAHTRSILSETKRRSLPTVDMVETGASITQEKISQRSAEDLINPLNSNKTEFT